jgi:DNA polymerase III subunit beta
MKVKCQQKDLAFALNLVNRAVSPNTTLPVLNNILIKAQGKKLYFSATNLEVAMTYFIDAEVFNEGAVTIPAKLITNYVALLKDAEVEIKLEEGLNLSLKTPLSHTKIKGIDAGEFPIIPEVEKGEEFSIETGLFSIAINQVGFAASSNVSRPVLTGVLFRLEGANLSMVATDSYRLSEKHLQLKKGVNEALDCIIPSHTVSELGKILSLFSEDEVNCHVTKNQILFSISNLKIISRLIEGNFPDYKKIIPNSSKTHVDVSVPELVLAVKKVSLFVRETNNNIKISVTNNGKLIVATDETQIGEGTAEVDVKMEGENNKVALNAQYILDVLSHISDQRVKLAIDNKVAPVTIKPAKKESNYTHIIMPLKL